jgi:DNA-binding transcriptional ArsR family regulator
LRAYISRVGLDSIPSPRREALVVLLVEGEKTTGDVTRTLELPVRTTERALEELTAHGLVRRRRSGDADNAPSLWTPTEIALKRWRSCAPEMSERRESEQKDRAVTPIRSSSQRQNG